MKRLAILIAGAIFLWGCGDDVLPPTTPQNFMVNSVSNTEMELTWDASEDNVGVEGYKVFRDGLLHTQVITTGLVDSGLVNSTTYCYSVRAFDAEDNQSDSTPTECATTLSKLDTARPTAPANLIANVISSSRIDLYWDASTDDVGVAGYNIYNAVGASKIASSVATFFSHTGLTSGTSYTYYVTAFDDSGKQSLASNTVSATTKP